VVVLEVVVVHQKKRLELVSKQLFLFQLSLVEGHLQVVLEEKINQMKLWL
jgi:hypothetical protein